MICKNGTMLITANAYPSETNCYVNLISINLTSNSISKIASYNGSSNELYKHAYLSIIKIDEDTACLFYGYNDRYSSGYMVVSVSSNGLTVLSDNENGGYFNCYESTNAPSHVTGNQSICVGSAAYIMPGGGTTYSDTAFSFYWAEDLNPFILNYRPLVDTNGEWRSNVRDYMIIQDDGSCIIFGYTEYDISLLLMKPLHVRKALIGDQIIGRVAEINGDGTIKIAI